MRPNIDLNWELHGPIKELAEARYNGDLSAAYRAVLKRGLKYTAIPREEIEIPTRDYESIFIPTNGSTHLRKPILFYYTFGETNLPQYSFFGRQRSIDHSEFTAALRTIGRFDKVDIDHAAFGIRRPQGMWAGFEFGNFIAALEEPLNRYGQTSFTHLEDEVIGLIFSVGHGDVFLSGKHHLEEGEITDLRVRALTTDLLPGSDSVIFPIFDELGATMELPSKFSGKHSTVTEGLPLEVEPIRSITTDSFSNLLMDAVLIKNPFADGSLAYDTAEWAYPDQVLMYVPPSLSSAESDEQGYTLEKVYIVQEDSEYLNMYFKGLRHSEV